MWCARRDGVDDELENVGRGLCVVGSEASDKSVKAMKLDEFGGPEVRIHKTFFLGLSHSAFQLVDGKLSG